MKTGQLVRLKVYGGEAVVMIVDANDVHVAVCKREEFEAAQREGRQPISVGFPVTDVIGLVSDTST
ncbi:MAG TPA: hypothetical protein VGA85_06745 [Dehalococcoidales bacterium]